jgi:hypothetical protein
MQNITLYLCICNPMNPIMMEFNFATNFDKYR